MNRLSLEERMTIRKKTLEAKEEKKMLAKFNKAVREGRHTSAEYWAHKIGIPHDCRDEASQIAWHACEHELGRELAEQEFIFD